MSKDNDTEQGEPRDPFEGMPFAEQIRKMIAEKGAGCDCSQMMTLMMTACCGPKSESKEPSESAVADNKQPTEK